MAFLLQNAFNGSALVQDANNYPHIRLFTTSKVSATTPQADFSTVEEPWAVSSNISISMNNTNDDDWLYFSAVCWLYAREIYLARKLPVGLYNTNWGGTAIEVRRPAIFILCFRRRGQGCFIEQISSKLFYYFSFFTINGFLLLRTVLDSHASESVVSNLNTAS